MKTYPCAKINLGLYVTERRSDGYHNLQTVFYPIPLCDELEVKVAEQDSLELEGIHVDGSAEDNLVMRTVRLLRNEGFSIPSLQIRLAKHIPSGAGLGGGSSDAAFMMKMLNQMFSLGLNTNEMEHRVAALGADCAFFIQCRPVFATGIGDQFTPVNVNLNGLWLLLVKPDDFISTREAYQGVTPQLPPESLYDRIQQPLLSWSSSIDNDFEQSVFPQHPKVASIKQSLYQQGALYASMSGSGSSVFGLFRKRPAEEIVASYAPHFVFTAEM